MEATTLAHETPPSDRELDVLKVLWEIAPASVRDVHEHLHPSLGLAFNTVQTLLRNMEEKGLVRHRAQGRTFIYSPRHTKERVAARFLNKVFDGALDQFVLSILRARDADPDELLELERLIAAARRAQQGRPGGEDK